MVPLTKIAGNHTTSLTPTAKPIFAFAANVDATSSATKYARYIHQCLCSLPSARILMALNCSKELITIPDLTSTLIKHYLPHSTATNKGHMHHHWANTASMHMQDNIVATCAKVDCMFTRHKICAMQDVFWFSVLVNAITSTIYTDVTSAFPVCSFKSMQYIFVAYVYNLNAIIVSAMPSCTNAFMVQLLTKVITILKSRGYRPALNVMDNKCSTTVKKHICSKKIDIHHAPPYNRCVNATE
jgi:hypothetical protein